MFRVRVLGCIALALTAACNASSPVAATGDPYASVRRALLTGIRSRLTAPDGGVYSYYRTGTQEAGSVAGAGHDKTSESVGLWLAYAARARDRTLFSATRAFYVRTIRASVDLAYWKVDAANRPARNADGSFSSAPIDELRLARALLAGASALGDTVARADARRIARALPAAVARGVLSDDVSWGPWEPSPGEMVFPAYLDIRAMRLLVPDVASWSSVATQSLALLRRAAAFRPPRTVYDPRSRRFSCDGVCDTTPGLWIALHLLDVGERDAARAVYVSYRTRLRKDGGLADAYALSGRASSDEDLAAYALFARLALRLGDRTTASDVVRRRLLPERITSGALAGLFSYDRRDPPSFDNLQILLTLEEFAGRRATAD